MGNQVAIRVLTRPGDTVIAGRRQHVVIYERGAAAANAGVQFHPVDDTAGVLDAEEVAYAVEAAHHHWPPPTLVAVENTHMPSGGRPWSIDGLAAVRIAAAGLPIHLDGARLFNAEVATGVPAARFAAEATTVMCCLSKGLCAPVGSLLAGPEDVIDEARVARKQLGGGMRQAGVIAAAGLVALDTMVERLAEDHRRARRLAEAVADRWPDGGCDPAAIVTNIVIVSVPDATAVIAALARAGVLADTIAPGVIRLMTHHDVDDADIEQASVAIAAL